MKKYYFRQRGRNTHLVKGQSRRRRQDGPAHFNFVNKDDPNYKKMYGTKYTEKQLMLLSGEIPWETTRLTEITILMRKAEQLGDMDNYEKAKRLHQLKKNQGVFVSDLSTEDALEMLRRLSRKQDRT